MKKIFLILLLFCSNAFADLTDIKFGRYQIADSQWNVSACTQTATCQIYSKSPGTMYKIPWTNGQWAWQTGQYVQFALTGNGTNPYEGKVYNSNGTQAGTIGTGHIINMGPDYFFFVGSDNNTGQLFSGSTGMSGTSGVSWTGTLNPTIAQANTYANATYSTVPLSSGQTATSTPSSSTSTPTPVPTPIYYNTGTVKIVNVYPTSNNSPSGEGATGALDNNVNTKYLNFDTSYGGPGGSGFSVKLNSGRAVTGIKFTTANDFPTRDPSKFTLYGSNDGVNWTKLADKMAIALSNSRYTESSVYSINNSAAFIYYYVIFDSTKYLDTYADYNSCVNANGGFGGWVGPESCHAVQIAEVTLIYDANSTATSTDTGSGSVVDPYQASAAPTVVSTSTTNSVSTSSSSSNTGSTTVSRPTTTGNYTDGFVGTTTVTTTTTTPVTTTTWSDGSTTTSNGTSTTTTSTTYTITPTLGTAPTYTRTAPNVGGNSIYVKQVYAGSNTSVRLEQDGNNNAVTGTDSGWATVDGNNSVISTKQFGQGNIVGLKMNAWGNNIDVKQQTAASGDVSNNIFNLESAGNGNSVTSQQQSNSNTAAVKLTYDINTVNLTQKGGTGNASYVTINGNWNTVSNTQNGSDNFSLVNISGDNNSATVNQTGSGHSALLNLIGNKNSVSVTQTGTGDTYSLQQTCTNPAGCSVSVIRNR
jgi:hypothetical protein